MYYQYWWNLTKLLQKWAGPSFYCDTVYKKTLESETVKSTVCYVRWRWTVGESGGLCLVTCRARRDAAVDSNRLSLAVLEHGPSFHPVRAPAGPPPPQPPTSSSDWSTPPAHQPMKSAAKRVWNSWARVKCRTDLRWDEMDWHVRDMNETGETTAMYRVRQ